jgi:hypothetical protein
MDAKQHITILRLESEHLLTLAERLKDSLTQLEEAVAQHPNPTYAEAGAHLNSTAELSQQVAREIAYLHTRIEELVTKSQNEGDPPDAP